MNLIEHSIQQSSFLKYWLDFALDLSPTPRLSPIEAEQKPFILMAYKGQGYLGCLGFLICGLFIKFHGIQ